MVLQKTNQNDVVSGAAADHPHGGRGNRHSLDLDLGLGRVRDLCRGGLIFSWEDAVAVAPGHVGHVRAFVLEMTSRVCDDAGGCCCSRDLVIEQLTSAMHNKKKNKKPQ